ncbi:hypothetical protein MAPG_10035 [Magnaporthiopsis poae ATCC 64411]|uniref:Uncharacterized protein n=1 Tax=Magnaporthiopsis poae (strain ATCC 64411 / 73-15) TaxID=644358 RepID=A0A0C4EBI6_MAGP6|nr:hypothetical protein MAPG_10035 [Magnaporthiopsis poae ATCC 64411]
MQRTPLNLLGRASASTRQARRRFLPVLTTTRRSAHPTLYSTPYRRLSTTSSDPTSTPPTAGRRQGDSSNMTAEDTTTTATTTTTAKLPALPEPGSSSNDDNGSPAQQLDLSAGQGSVTLDHLGPMVVNRDGTMSRIANWGEMSDIERQNTLRVLGRRNQLRLGDLRAAKAKDDAEPEAAGAGGETKAA